MRDLSCGDTRVYLEIEIRRVHCRSCGAVKQEKPPWLANNLYYTKRFAFYFYSAGSALKNAVMAWK